MVLLTRYQARRATRPTTTIWNTQPRTTGSFQGATLVRGVDPSASTAIGYFPCRPQLARAAPSLSIAVSVEGNRSLATIWSRQRIGGAYCRPPWVHSLFRPRSILSTEPEPTLRSKLSP